MNNPPLAEMISVRTDDGVLLHGALFKSNPKGKVAAFLIHGGWGNFYTGLGRFLPGPLTECGVSVLSLNNRGHDYGTVADGEPCIGLLREKFEDCGHDITAGLRLLKERGYQRVILIGHSYGAAKVAYSQFQKPDIVVEALILCSPAAPMREVSRFYLDIPYEQAVKEAQRLVDEGREENIIVFRHHGPIPLVATARTFLSVWGPETLHDVQKYIDEITKPILITICNGDRICFNYARAVYDCLIQARLNEFITISEGNHYYLGVEKEVNDEIIFWLNRDYHGYKKTLSNPQRQLAKTCSTK